MNQDSSILPNTCLEPFRRRLPLRIAKTTFLWSGLELDALVDVTRTEPHREMSHTDGNRARFFSSGQASDSSANVLPSSEKYLSTMLPSSNVATNGVSSALNRTASRGSENDIVTQRTRMIETETLFKPRKDRGGKLNLSGLLKGGNKPADNPGIAPCATITEMIGNDPEISSESNNALATPDNPLFLKPSSLNVQAAAFIPSELNVFKFSELTVETPVNQKSFHVNQLSREDHLVSDEVLMSSGKQHNSFQPNGVSATVRALGTKSNLIGTTNRPTIGTKDDQCSPMTSSNDIVRNSVFSAQRSNINGECARNGGKRGNDTREDEASNSKIVKKRKENNAIELSRSLDSHFLQPSSPDESSILRSINDTDALNIPGSASFATALGRDIENYIASHLNEYEQAKIRWTNCSREEWERGADEIAEKFTKILDFVKDHMKRKITLYATLQTKLDDHRAVRSGITKTLKEAKDELVTKTGVLIEERRTV